jgi:hypothetical protein
MLLKYKFYIKLAVSHTESSASFSVVLAFLTVIALYITLSFDIFDQRVREYVAIGADQNMTLP